MYNLNLFYGEEKLLIDEAIQNIKESIIPKHAISLDYIELDGKKVSDDMIMNICTTVPMVSSKKLIVIKDAYFLESNSRKNAGIDIDKLYSTLSRLSDYICVVFSCNKPDKRKKLYKLFDKKGFVKNFKKPNLDEKARWIQNRAKKYGKNMTNSAAYFLAEYTKELYQADEEIKKLAFFLGNRKNIRKEDLNLIFSKSIENNIFEMMDHIGKKQSGKAIEVLNDLLMKGEKGIVILFMLSKHVINLISVKAMEAYTFNEIKQILKLHPFVLKKAIKQSKNFSLQELKNALKLCQTIDLNLKQGKINEKLGLEILITEIAS